MADPTDIEHLEQFVSDNDDLIELEDRIGRFNAFDALRIARTEIRHSNFLSWLLTPSESHGQDELFLKTLLIDLVRKARQSGVSPPLSAVELDGAELRGVEVRREWRNIDLLIICESPSFVIAIENKVDGGEHSGQLERYEQIIAESFPGKRALFVFLTPEGEDASDEDWVAFSYADLHRSLHRARRANAGSLGGDVVVFIDHYLNLIENRFMESPDIDRLCRQIYTVHRRALDLIWDRVGGSPVVETIREWLAKQGDTWIVLSGKQREIEFLPRTWDKMLPEIGKRKTFPKSHWITLRLITSDTAIRFFVLVCPTIDPEVRRRTIERVTADKKEFGLSTKKKELTGEWTRILSETLCTLPEEGDADMDAVMKSIEERLARLLNDTRTLPAEMKKFR